MDPKKQVASSDQYTDTGALTDEARKAMIEQAVKDLLAIENEQQEEKKDVKVTKYDLDKHFLLLARKRERYEKRRMNRLFGMKRHRQKRIVGKRGHRETRLWEQGKLLKHAHDAFMDASRGKDETS